VFQKITYLILLLGISCLAKANYVNTITATDSLNEQTTINVRYFDEQQLNQYKQEKEFQYILGEGNHNGIIENLKGLVKKIVIWLFSFSSETDFNWDVDGVLLFKILEIILWVAILFFLIYGVLKILGLDFNSLFYKTTDVKPTVQFNTIEEDIHEIDFNKSIEEAIADKNYRYATRLYYLKTLKLLADKELINWQKDKTNADYVFEIEKTKYSADFKTITKLFNYSWYGKVLFNKTTFNITQQNFVAFYNKLNLHHA